MEGRLYIFQVCWGIGYLVISLLNGDLRYNLCKQVTLRGL